MLFKSIHSETEMREGVQQTFCTIKLNTTKVWRENP